MARRSVLALSAAFASPAVADVTPEDVWAQWTGYLSAFGYTLESEPVRENGNIRIPDFAMTMYVPADPDSGRKGGTVAVTFGDIALTDLGDGTVGIEIPEDMTVSISGDGPGDEDFSARINIRTDGARTVASGDVDDITYDYTAARTVVSLEEVEGEQGDIPIPGTVAVTLEDAAGRNRIAVENDETRVDQSFEVARFVYDVALSEVNPGQQGDLTWQGTLNGLTSSTSGVIPDEVDPLAIDEAVADGYAVAADFGFDSGQGSFEFSDPKQQVRLVSSSEGGRFSLSLSSAGMAYDVLTEDLSLSIAGSELPFPIDTTAAAIGLGIQLPLLAGEEEQPFGATLTLTDVTIPDAIWMMADPSNGLPHDPVTVEVAISGQSRLFVNILNEAEMSALDRTGGQPGEVTRLNLDALRLRGAGASIDGSAAFDIDNSSSSIFAPDLPAFGGTANLRLTGVTGLLSTLGQLGIIPMQQAMMTGAMIQQLGRQESGPDDLSAEIELSPTGSLTINGAPFPLQ
ncbi:hypothetical protein OB2597_11596 [Pseudooceanicola batsensis HTCC2597]|uniref:DUF2125 domain-containing protein n=2 Tax=Pseudooceanicola batsensis TaxID=314255 RepID=A3TW89_PSEBH|nr:hypothetical protein OB2597_11596 [Pseudooceanicola batsensis HTCC2597]